MSAVVNVLSVTTEDRDAAWAIFKKFDDQTPSLIDCTTFAVMKRLGLTRVLTVDRHFALMGFVPVPPASVIG